MTEPMRILVVGGGGREHALCWRIRHDRPDAQIFAAPGNGGTSELATNVAPEGSTHYPTSDAVRAMAMKKVSVTLDADLVAEIKTEVGERGFSAYLNESIRRRRQHERLRRLERELTEEFGPIPDEARRWAQSLDWPEERDA